MCDTAALWDSVHLDRPLDIELEERLRLVTVKEHHGLPSRNRSTESLDFSGARASFLFDTLQEDAFHYETLFLSLHLEKRSVVECGRMSASSVLKVHVVGSPRAIYFKERFIRGS
jgi:hypothetical protein